MFVDKVSISLQAGKGGDGKLSFRHEKFRPMGGPDGGDGGDGGDIVLIANHDQNTLSSFRYKKLLKAEDGQPGGKAKRHGKNGRSLEVKVPVGTVVADSKGKLLADLSVDNQIFLAARGGKGGFGNAHFTSSTRQAPRVAERGEPGEQMEASLELKMIADVGIIGLPNAGKSTLLSVISNAKPEIADYPFTTLRPNLGVVDINGRTSLLFADIPGLIEGASQGKGLGDEFLRHVERTSVLLHLIDIYNDDIAAAYKAIMSELKAYASDLSKRPQIVVLTKIDGVDKKRIKDGLETLKKLVPKNTPILAISAPSGEEMQAMLRAVEKRVAQTSKAAERKSKKPKLPIIGLRVSDDSWQVKKSGGGYVVTGKKIERFAVRTNFASLHGQQRLRDIMAKMGILRELERRGIKPEQDIIIGGPEIGRLEY